jgi:uncharacterized protein YndB with AHSA1/START domain
MTDFVSSTTIDVDASPAAVWRGLTETALVKRVMFGSDVISNWRVGSSIVYRGEWEGKPFEDHGVIVDYDEPRMLRTTHFSPMSGLPDVPENYHVVSYLLEETPGGTRVTLEQTNNASEEAARHSDENWNAVLANLKRVVEEL